jgi:translational activator of cytochrome c oxidase 1
MKKSLMHQRYSAIVRRAVAAGGPDPKINTTLKDVISSAIKDGVPKASIDKAIKAGESRAINSAIYEVMGPGGCFLLLDIETDNLNRSRQTIKQICKKIKGTGLLKEGTVKHAFDAKGMVKLSRKDRNGADISYEKAEEIAIEAGAEEVEDPEEDSDSSESWILLTAVSDLYSVKSKIEKTMSDVVIEEYDTIYKATSRIELSDEDMEKAATLCDALQESPEVAKLYDNIQ